MATIEIDRTNKSPAEYDFIHRLATIGATSNETLANMYFTGDWAGFERTVRAYAGDWVSFQALLAANPATSLAVCDYLKELRADPQAPLNSPHTL